MFEHARSALGLLLRAAGLTVAAGSLAAVATLATPAVSDVPAAAACPQDLVGLDVFIQPQDPDGAITYGGANYSNTAGSLRAAVTCADNQWSSMGGYYHFNAMGRWDGDSYRYAWTYSGAAGSACNYASTQADWRGWLFRSNNTICSSGWVYTFDPVGGWPQGNNSIEYLVATCDSFPGADLWTDSGTRLQRGPWGCNMPSGVGPESAAYHPMQTIFVDSQVGSASHVAPSGSATVYRSVGDYTFDWTWSDPAPSSGYRHSEAVLQRAPVSSPGVCSSSWTNHTSTGATTAGDWYVSGMWDGWCWRMAARVTDRANNTTAWAYSAPLLIDLGAPSVSFNDGMNTYTAGAETTCGNSAGSGSSVDRWCVGGGALRSYQAQSDATSGVDLMAIGIDSAPASGGTCSSSWARRETRWVDSSANTDLMTTWSGLPDNACYRWSTTVWDRAGRTASTNSDAILLDLGNPTASWVTPSGSATRYQSGSSAFYDWNFSDSASAFAGSEVSVQRAAIASPGICSGSWTTVDAFSLGGTSWTLNDMTASACWRVGVRVSDTAGNWSAWAYSAPALVDASPPPAPLLDLADTGGGRAYDDGTTIWFNPATAGSLVLRSTGTDPESDIAGHAFGGLSAAGWTYTPGAVNGNPATRPLAWSTSSGDGTITVFAVNRAALVSSPAVRNVTADAGAPTAAFSVPTDGISFQRDTSLDVTWTETDSGSGVAGRSLQRQSGAVVSTGTCDGVSWSDDGAPTSAASPQPTSDLAHATCYRWVVTVRDNVGNSSSTTSGEVMVDVVAPSGNLTVVGTDGGLGVTRADAVEVTLGASDEHSGVSKVRYAIDGANDWNDAPWLDYETNKTKTLSIGDTQGDYTIMAQVMDRAGNVRTLYSTILLQSDIIPPTFGPGARIYDCDSGELLASNESGTVYWTVGRSLCLVPYAVVVSPGTRGTDAPLSGQIVPGGEVTEFAVEANPYLDTNFSDLVTWPSSAVDQFRATSPETPNALRFVIRRETSQLQSALPFVTLPFSVKAEIEWLDAGGNRVGPTELMTVDLEIRVIAQNLGTGD